MLDGIQTGRRGLWIGLLLFALLLAFAWVGFLASDDVTYARGAYGWMEHFPYVGGHGTIRYPITIPMALSFTALGENSFAMVLPSLIYVTVFMMMAWWAARRVAGPLPAFTALIALVTCPLMVVQSTVAGVDVIELAFLFAAFLLTWSCAEAGKANARRLFAAGALVGLAFLTRETAIFTVPFFALLFLTGHRIGRWPYLWIAVGFVAVWLMEVAYLWAMTGDPLYRINISLNHDSTIDRAIDVAGNAIVHPLVDPLLVMLINQEFMLLVPIALPLALWLCFGRGHSATLRHFARLAGLFALVWFVCIGAATSLLPLNPRYFMVTAAILALLGGIGIGRLFQIGRTWFALGTLALLVGTNLLGIAVENRNPVFGEHQLAAVARTQDRLIHTDPMTRYRADILLRWEGELAGVVDAPPQPGDLFYANPERAAVANFKMDATALPAYQPQPSWTLVTEYRAEPDLLVRTLNGTGLYRVMPASLWDKLSNRTAPTYLYEVR